MTDLLIEGIAMFRKMFEQLKSECIHQDTIFSSQVTIDRDNFIYASIEVYEWSNDKVVLYEAVYSYDTTAFSRFSFDVCEALNFIDTWLDSAKYKLISSTAEKWSDDDDYAS